MERNSIFVISILLGVITYYVFNHISIAISISYLVHFVDSLLHKNWKNSIFSGGLTLSFLMMSIKWGYINAHNIEKFSIAVLLALFVGALPSLINNFKRKNV